MPKCSSLFIWMYTVDPPEATKMFSNMTRKLLLEHGAFAPAYNIGVLTTSNQSSLYSM